MNGQKKVLFVLIGMMLLLANGCASVHSINSRSTRVTDDMDYAVIKIKNHDWLSGQLVKESPNTDKDPVYWNSFVDVDSRTKGLAKIAFGLTPLGLVTKPWGEAPVLYRVPAGKVNLLAFNYYVRGIIAKSDETERANWGTIISANLEAGKTYTLNAEMIATNKGHYEQIPAYLVLKDTQGNLVHSDSYFFMPKEEIKYTEFKYTPKKMNEGNAIYQQASMAGKISMDLSTTIADAVTDEMLAYMNALGKFTSELEARKIPEKE